VQRRRRVISDGALVDLDRDVESVIASKSASLASRLPPCEMTSPRRSEPRPPGLVAGVTNVVLTTVAPSAAATLMARSSRDRASGPAVWWAIGPPARTQRAGRPASASSFPNSFAAPASTSCWLAAGISTPSNPIALTAFR
jgi:hypothetical protein